MARKDIQIDPRIGNPRVGLMITRGQIVHLGHTALMAQMAVDNNRNIIGFGSSQKSGEPGNPLTSDQKRRAQIGLWGDAFKMIFLQDIGATDRNTDWADYVLDRIRANQLPEPTDFYAGSLHEARWYEERFAPLRGAPSYVRGKFKVWENPEIGKRIHILDRQAESGISSSEIRALIEQRDHTWHAFVPAKLWDFYEWEYPGHLRAAVTIDAMDPLPSADRYPVGTKLIRAGDPDVLILRDDGRWRVRTDAESGKSMGD